MDRIGQSQEAALLACLSLLGIYTERASPPVYLHGAGPRADHGHALALEAAGVVPARRVEGCAREVLDAWCRRRRKGSGCVCVGWLVGQSRDHVKGHPAHTTNALCCAAHPR